MGQVERREAIDLVQRIMDLDYADDDEAADLLAALARAFGCPSGFVSDLIFWPRGNASFSAAEVVEQAAAYRPIAL